MKLVHVEIAYSGDVERDPALETLIVQSVENALKTASLRLPRNGELSVLLADDAQLQELNRRWRGKDRPTNVLSFPSRPIKPGETPDPLLGDLAISIETARREAQIAKRAFDDHMAHLTVHGLLHLFGYDHLDDQDARVMERLETTILEEMGLTDPYFELMDA